MSTRLDRAVERFSKTPYRFAAAAALGGAAALMIGLGASLPRWADQTRFINTKMEEIRAQSAANARRAEELRQESLSIAAERAKLDAQVTELDARLDAAYANLAKSESAFSGFRSFLDAACGRLGEAERADCTGLLADIGTLQEGVRFANLVETGAEAMRAGETDNAITRYQAALEIEPNDSAALNFLGYALFRAGRLDEAAPPIERSIKANDQNVYAWLNLVKTHCAGGQVTRAKRVFADGRRATEGALKGMAELDTELPTLCGSDFLKG